MTATTNHSRRATRNTLGTAYPPNLPRQRLTTEAVRPQPAMSAQASSGSIE